MTDYSKNAKNLATQWWKDVETIPVFINNTNHQHMVCREISKEMWGRICILLEPKVLATRHLEKLYDILLGYLTDILCIDLEVGTQYNNMIFDLLDYYMKESESLEVYETAANIKNFLDVIEKQKNKQ